MARVIELEIKIRTKFTLEDATGKLFNIQYLYDRLKNPSMYRIIDYRIVSEINE
jgi:hypothetical protein